VLRQLRYEDTVSDETDRGICDPRTHPCAAPMTVKQRDPPQAWLYLSTTRCNLKCVPGLALLYRFPAVHRYVHTPVHLITNLHARVTRNSGIGGVSGCLCEKVRHAELLLLLVPPWKVLVLVAGGNGVSEPGVRWGNLSVGRRARGMLTDRYGTVLVGYCVRVGFLDWCEVRCGGRR